MNRRDVLRLSAVAGATGALTLESLTFADADTGGGPAAAADGTTVSRTVTGHLPIGSPDYVYLPVEVPAGINRIDVSYSYDRPAVPAGTAGNACDIGIFDQRGTDLGGRGFRGWSGGARTAFTISAEDATPAYLPGPVGAGTWHVVLAPYTVAPQGLDYSVTVTLTRGAPGTTPKPVYPPERAKGRGAAWYRGDNHLHSVYSDGKRTPAEIAALARAAGLDFINSSEHNTTSAHRAWEGLWGDDLLIMTGEEVTTRNGHVVAMGMDPDVFIDWRYRARDNAFGKYARRIRQAGGLVIPAHPHATCVACNWKFGFNDADAVEVWNGPWTADDEATVAEWDNTLVAFARGERGSWLPGVGHSDAHRDPDVVGLPQTVVRADDLSRTAIQAGIKAGRCWVAESAAVDLAFSATDGAGRSAGIGERLPARPDAEVTVRLKVSGAPGCSVRLVTDEGQLFASALPDSGAGTVEWRTTPQYAAYVRAEVRHPAADGGASGVPGAMAAVTNPIFLGTWGG